MFERTHPTAHARRLALAAGLLAPWLLVVAGTPGPASTSPAVWRSRFENGLADWPGLGPVWGSDNHAFLPDSAVMGRLLRVHMRRGSIDPGSMLRRGLPRSGTGFKARVLAGASGKGSSSGAHSATLRYRVRFAPDFDFVRGGKLPGLFGGVGHSGGRLPNGHDGFSLRLMWREAGQVEVYAYLPTSHGHGTSLLRGRFVFQPGRWHEVVQAVVLNTPGQADGVLRLWLDGQLAGQVDGLRLRDVDSVRLDGVFFDVFFGGNDDSWAARADTHIDFAAFEVMPTAALQALPNGRQQ